MSQDLKMNDFAKLINGERALQAAYKGQRWMNVREDFPIENANCYI